MTSIQQEAKSLLSNPSFATDGAWHAAQPGSIGELMFGVTEQFAAITDIFKAMQEGEPSPSLEQSHERLAHARDREHGTMTISATVSRSKIDHLVEVGCMKWKEDDEGIEMPVFTEGFRVALEAELDMGNEIKVMMVDNSIVVSGIHSERVSDFENKFKVKILGLETAKPRETGRDV